MSVTTLGNGMFKGMCCREYVDCWHKKQSLFLFKHQEKKETATRKVRIGVCEIAVAHS